MSGSDFASGAGFVAALGAIGAVVKAVFFRRESIEERLQRWQVETVARVNDENKDLRTAVANCERRHASRDRADDIRNRRMVAVEMTVRLVMPELRALDPSNQVFRKIGALLRSLPVDPQSPDEWADLVAQLNADERHEMGGGE